MSEENTLSQDDLSTLKTRADQLGISYHPSIGIEKLREKVVAAMAEKAAADPAPKSEAPVAVVETEVQKRKRLRLEANRLIRIRLTCMNPAKKEWDGEIFTVANSAVGTISKYVPFSADEGWHVPYMIYEQLVARQCQVFVNAKSQNGVTVRQGKLIKEFAIEVLDPLTPAELKDLAQRQAIAAGA